MVKKRDNIKDIKKDTLNIYNIGNIIENIKSDADKMYKDLGYIDTKALYKLIVLNDNPIFDIENITDFDVEKTYISILDDIINNLNDLLVKNVKDLSDKEIKEDIEYINNEIDNYTNSLLLDNCIDRAINTASKFSNAIAFIQTQEIKNTIGVDAFYQLVDFNNLPFKSYVSPLLLYEVKSLANNKDLLNEIYKIKTKDELLELDISGLQQRETNSYLEDFINQPRFKELYFKVQSKTNKINDLFNKVNKKYGNEVLIKVNKNKIVKQPQKMSIDLNLPKIFNNTYLFNKYTSIDKNGNGKYDIQLNINADINNLDDIKELRDVIFIDEFSKQQLTLLPIDLALFVGFTNLNALNGNNVLISLSDVFKYISEDKSVRVRKGQKGYNTYVDKMRAFRTFKAKSVIKDRATNKPLIEFKDAIPILDNYEVIENGKEVKYVIGASAILSILNWLSSYEGIDYKTTYSTANQYINDGQSNTIEIINMKYGILIKVLQMKNRANKDAVANHKISLDDLYNQTALIKGKELSRTDKKRLRDNVEHFLKHLKTKNLLSSYQYTPIGKKVSNALSNSKKDDIYIKI